jgi:hypothetical protein
VLCRKLDYRMRGIELPGSSCSGYGGFGCGCCQFLLWGLWTSIGQNSILTDWTY